MVYSKANINGLTIEEIMKFLEQFKCHIRYGQFRIDKHKYRTNGHSWLDVVTIGIRYTLKDFDNLRNLYRDPACNYFTQFDVMLYRATPSKIKKCVGAITIIYQNQKFILVRVAIPPMPIIDTRPSSGHELTVPDVLYAEHDTFNLRHYPYHFIIKTNGENAKNKIPPICHF